jgi:hypothetical protein
METARPTGMGRKKTRSPRTRAEILGHDQQQGVPDGTQRGRGVSDVSARLPHERDEYPNPKNVKRRGSGPRDLIRQAARDVDRGLRDTEARGIPSDVPTTRSKKTVRKR